jgi:hypothetical protein
MKAKRAILSAALKCGAICVLLTNCTVRADSIVVPAENRFTPGSRAASVPFGDFNQRWQQFYVSSQFNGAAGDLLRITELRFRMDEEDLGASFSTTAQGLTVSMSTTSKDFNTASTTFAANHGSDLFVAHPTSDVLLTGTRGTSFDVVVPLPNAYIYNRKLGNLAVEIQLSSSLAPFMDAMSDQPTSTFTVSGLTTQMSGQKTSQALVTEIIYTVVPEPMPLKLAVIGTLALSAMYVKRRRNCELPRTRRS